MFGVEHIFGNDGCQDLWSKLNINKYDIQDGVVDQFVVHCWGTSPGPGEEPPKDYCDEDEC